MKKIGNDINLSRFLACFVFVLSLFTSLSAFSAPNLMLSTDRSEIYAGETFRLKVSIEANFSQASPKASQALPEELETLNGPSTQFFTRSINGKSTSTATWEWVLRAKKEGSYIIPAFELSGLKSNQLKLKVYPIKPHQMQLKLETKTFLSVLKWIKMKSLSINRFSSLGNSFINQELKGKLKPLLCHQALKKLKLMPTIKNTIPK